MFMTKNAAALYLDRVSIGFLSATAGWWIALCGFGPASISHLLSVESVRIEFFHWLFIITIMIAVFSIMSSIIQWRSASPSRRIALVATPALIIALSAVHLIAWGFSAG
jgi:hypothetical protein